MPPAGPLHHMRGIVVRRRNELRVAGPHVATASSCTSQSFSTDCVRLYRGQPFPFREAAESNPLPGTVLSLNSLRPSDAHMRQWTNHHWFRQWLVAWSPSHYLNRWSNIVSWTLGNKFNWNINQNSYIFIHENAFENGGHVFSASMCQIIPSTYGILQCLVLVVLVFRTWYFRSHI